jgi:hypothetical protein
MALERALEHGDNDVMLSGLAAYIEEHHIGEDLPPIDASGNPDRETMVRMRTVVTKSRAGRRWGMGQGVRVM